MSAVNEFTWKKILGLSLFLSRTFLNRWGERERKRGKIESPLFFFKGVLKKENGTSDVVAIKVLKETASRQAEDDFMREVEIMSAFRHENILSLLGIVLKGKY